MATRRPTVFISSTIADFHDLRWALKYWLEQLGYQVLLSEKNDFPKPLDKNALDACLEVIDQVDYFVLLIGARVGQMYNDSRGVSITRMEYRHAYNLMKAGRIKLAIFVRRDLWTIRQDRRALLEFLEANERLQKEIEGDSSRVIANHPSPLVSDAVRVFDFLREVTREEESSRAAAGEGLFPPGNWVHSFSAFQEIVEALRQEFKIADNLARVALTQNLKRELISNLALLTLKSEGKIYPTADFYLEKERYFLNDDLGATSAMPNESVKNIARYSLLAPRGEGLSTDFIDQAVKSGEFLEFDRDRGVYESTLLNDNLVLLSAAIRNHKRI